MTLPYTHLTLAERREIYRLRSAQIPVAVIAQRLNRHPSTIYREISRNWMHDEEPLYQGYFHVAADMQARARRQRLGKLSRHLALAVYVIDCLKAAWSPEQIAGRLRRSGAPERVSHETIYRFVYGAQGQHLGLYKDLPTARRRRQPATSASRAVSSSRPATPSSSVRRRSQLAPASVTGRAI
jgi:IS30 family transposase